MDKEIVELHACVFGRVQGVSFRWTTREFAKQLGVLGTVENLPNGAVEIYAQGTPQNLDRFIEKLKGPNGPGRIEQITQEVTKPVKVFNDFIILS